MFAAIILGISIFMFLVIIHECGHFRAARISKVKVEEFGVGIPPKAFTIGRDSGGTEYTANRIPLGGFVRLKGEDPTNTKEFLAKDSFISASVGHKLLILFAGITVNFLFAWFAFSVSFWQGITPINILPDTATIKMSTSYLMPSQSFLVQQGLIDEGIYTEKPLIANEILPGSRAEMAGLKAGDIITALGDDTLNISTLSELLKNYFGKTVDITFVRDGKTEITNITCAPEECFLGISMTLDQPQYPLPVIKFGLKDAIAAGWHEIVVETKMTFVALGKLGKNLLSFNKEKIKGSVKGLSGPVGIVKMIEVVFAKGGGRQLLAFAGMISLALAVFNLLPIPALDGGRALSVIIQAIGKRNPTSYFVIENYLNMFFFVLMMLLGVRVMLKDLVVMRGVHIPFIG